MRVILIANEDAGDGDVDPATLGATLRRRGNQVISASKTKEIVAALEEPADLVVVAGGDGTVAKVARHLSGREVPVLILPVGTANNIARSLGIDTTELDVDKVCETWRRTWIDVGLLDERIVVEAAGCGGLPQLIRSHSGEERGIHREAKQLGQYLEELPLFDYRITLDGREVVGEAFIIEAMIMKYVGPSLLFAPDADPGDGLLDVVIAGESDRASLRRYLSSGGKRHHPELPTYRAASVTIACDAPWHVDDELKPRKTHTVTVRTQAWQAFVP